MFRVPEYNHDLSLRLSKVLDDIGVNERMVMRRRKSALLEETILTIAFGKPAYNFGSMSEGTTTLGLNSDSDFLCIFSDYNLIQDYAEWQQGHINLLMVQDEETAPGYCKLQMIRPGVPLPVTDTDDQHCFRDEYNRILLKTSIIKDYFPCNEDSPASTTPGKPGLKANDVVLAFSCMSWPYEAREWLSRTSGLWPTADIKRDAESSGCMVVPVGSKFCQLQGLEWRISTCKAERCLMFNLNITQLRCYVLIKIIKKTYRLDSLTSYMCKTVLLHCIEISHPKEWREDNLFACLLFCLHRLFISVLHRSCPHFIIRRNNLMVGRISSADKNKLMAIMREMMQNLGLALLTVQIDEFGERLQPSIYQENVDLFSSVQIRINMTTSIVYSIAYAICSLQNYLLKECRRGQCYSTVLQCVIQILLKCLRLHRQGNYFQQKAVSFLVPIVCSILGSVLASSNIGTGNSVSLKAISLLSMGFNSDVSSGKLKLASVFYCAGDILRAEFILRETERLYCLDTVEPVCRCKEFEIKCRSEFCRVCDNLDEKAISRVCAFCIKFIPTEINCIPLELQYELFRSTEEDLQYRDDNDDYWMDSAVVDSLPFLYFLQYKTYGRLQKYNEQLIALTNLVRTIFTERNLGHRETALNLLGQCLEQENSPGDAVTCYKMSLNVRERNNAAKFHLCRVIGNMLNSL